MNQNFEIYVRVKPSTVKAVGFAILILTVAILWFILLNSRTENFSGESGSGSFTGISFDIPTILIFLVVTFLAIGFMLYFQSKTYQAANLSITPEEILISGKDIELTLSTNRIIKITIDNNIQNNRWFYVTMQAENSDPIIFRLRNNYEAEKLSATLSKIKKVQL